MVERPSIELYIDELVLHGFSPHDRYRIGLALETELKRLFAEKGLSSFSHNTDLPFLNAGQFKINHLANTGRYVANAVYSSMNSSGPAVKNTELK